MVVWKMKLCQGMSWPDLYSVVIEDEPQVSAFIKRFSLLEIFCEATGLELKLTPLVKFLTFLQRAGG